MLVKIFRIIANVLFNICCFSFPALGGIPSTISGSATLTTPSFNSFNLNGGATLPSGFFFPTGAGILKPPNGVTSLNATLENASVIVVATYGISGNSTLVLNSLSVGSSAAATFNPISTFSTTAAVILTNFAAQDQLAPNPLVRFQNIEALTAIIRSGAGVNGLD